MTRRRTLDALSGDLFTSIPQPAPAEPGGMDYRTRIAVLIADMLDDARAHDPELDRYAVAAAVSRLVGKEVSKGMLDAYTAESRTDHNAPAWLMPALEVACHSHRYSEWLSGVRGGRFLLGPAALDAEIGRVRSEMDTMREQLRALQGLRRRVR